MAPTLLKSMVLLTNTIFCMFCFILLWCGHELEILKYAKNILTRNVGFVTLFFSYLESALSVAIVLVARSKAVAECSSSFGRCVSLRTCRWWLDSLESRCESLSACSCTCSSTSCHIAWARGWWSRWRQLRERFPEPVQKPPICNPRGTRRLHRTSHHKHVSRAPSLELSFG